MSQEIHCADCNRTWHVEQIEEGEMHCPYCMSRIPLDGPTSAPEPARDRAPRPSPPVAPEPLNIFI